MVVVVCGGCWWMGRGRPDQGAAAEDAGRGFPGFFVAVEVGWWGVGVGIVGGGCVGVSRRGGGGRGVVWASFSGFGRRGLGGLGGGGGGDLSHDGIQGDAGAGVDVDVAGSRNAFFRVPVGDGLDTGSAGSEVVGSGAVVITAGRLGLVPLQDVEGLELAWSGLDLFDDLVEFGLLSLGEMGVVGILARTGMACGLGA